MRITIDRNFTGEDLSNILVTAFDGGYGGCWYWAEPANQNWLKTEEGQWISVEIKETEPGSNIPGPKLVVNHETIEKGIQKIFEQGVLPGRNDIRAELLREECALDVDQADVIIQLGLFGKIIYG